jgi:hypothetical protein
VFLQKQNWHNWNLPDKRIATRQRRSIKKFQSAEAELKTLKAKKASLQKQLELAGINTASLTSENIQSVM